jgi:hypothetical protein
MNQENSNTTNAQQDKETVVEIRSSTNGIQVVTRQGNHNYNKYGFVNVKDKHDVVNINVSDNSIAYTGKSNLAVHYTDGQDKDKLPDCVINRLEDEGYDIIKGSAGWFDWNGRPEFSETFFEG